MCVDIIIQQSNRRSPYAPVILLESPNLLYKQIALVFNSCHIKLEHAIPMQTLYYLDIIFRFFADEKFSSCSAPCVRNEMAQWKKLFHSCCSKGLENFSLIVCEKHLSA